MSKGTYAERLSAYIHELPTERQGELLLKVALLVFPEGSSEQPNSLTAFYDALKKLLAEFHPELHTSYDREALTQSLGEYLVEWWGENLKRPLTGRDLDQLLDNLPDYGIREALQRAAQNAATEDNP